MEENWILRNRKYKALAERLHVDPLLAKIIANRVEPEEAEDFWNKDAPLENPFLMADMEVAVTRYWPISRYIVKLRSSGIMT